jgi:hypothetical protein
MKNLYSTKIKKEYFSSILIAILLVVASVRGIFVINLNIPASIVYVFTSILMLLLSIYGTLICRNFKEPQYKKLFFLLKLNTLFFLLYILLELLLGQGFDFSVQYYFIAPFSVFVFYRLKETHFYYAIIIIAFLIGYSVLDNFFESLTGENGVDSVLQYHIKLRPDIFENLSRTGDFFRVGGYTGSYHDSANILGMLSTYFFILFIAKGKIIDLVIFLFAIFSLTITQSAANIIITILSILLFSLLTIYYSNKAKNIIYFLVILLFLLIFMNYFGDIMKIFTLRLNKEEGDWEGMNNSLNLKTLLQSTIFFIFGHSLAFSAQITKTEVSFLKQIVQFGLIQSLIHFSILVYPFYIIQKLKIKLINLNKELWPLLATLFFGFFSMIHYGSLMRITSIFLFYSIASQIYVIIHNDLNKKFNYRN